MRNLIIIGAGGFGREIFTLARDTPAHGVDWRIKGFLDSRSDVLDAFAKDANKLPGAVYATPQFRDRHRRDVGIIGDPMTYAPQSDDVFVCALGDPAQRRKYAQPILDKGGEFVPLFHPQAAVSVFVTHGIGCIVGPFASISPDVRLGRFVTVNSYTAIGHDVTIGDWCEIDGHCMIAGRARIGSGVKVHAGAVITPDSRIGNDAVIGAGSVVLGHVPSGVTVFGNPAKKFEWR